MAATRTVDVFENGSRVVRHTFYGRTPTEARAFEAAHRKTDRFLDAALRRQRFQGLRLTARRVRAREC